MASFLLLAFVFVSPASVAGVECAADDMTCLANADITSMLQANILETKQDITTLASHASASSTFDFKQGLLNATVTQIQNIQPMNFKSRVIYASISWGIYVALALLIWLVCYPGAPAKAAVPGDIEDPKLTLENGHFACLTNPEICICACLCPGLRWADTMNLIGFMKIAVGLSIYFFCQLLNGFGYGNAYFGVATLLVILYNRHRLREKFELPSWTLGSCCFDAIYIFFCPWCAIAQEARTVTHHLQKS